MKRIKELIREYVTDHYHHFGFYPADVEVDDVLYSYEHYMYILSMPVQKLSTRGCILPLVDYYINS